MYFLIISRAKYELIERISDFYRVLLSFLPLQRRTRPFDSITAFVFNGCVAIEVHVALRHVHLLSVSLSSCGFRYFSLLCSKRHHTHSYCHHQLHPERNKGQRR